MALTNSQYNTIMKTYEEKQLASRQELDAKIAHVNKHVPRYHQKYSYLHISFACMGSVFISFAILLYIIHT